MEVTIKEGHFSSASAEDASLFSHWRGNGMSNFSGLRPRWEPRHPPKQAVSTARIDARPKREEVFLGCRHSDDVLDEAHP